MITQMVIDDELVEIHPDAIAKYKAGQATWMKQNKVEVGTKVKVTSVTKAGQDGWCNNFTEEMKKYVGATLKVFGLNDKHPERGLALDTKKKELICYSFPYFVLEVIK